MQGLWLRMGGVMAGIIVVVILLLAIPRHNAQLSGQATGGAVGYTVVDACDVLTKSVADVVIGDAEPLVTNSADPFITNGIQVSNCGYAYGTPNVNDIVTINLQVRSATTHIGAITNQREFTMLKTSGAQQITGYGDAVFWVQSSGQLHIKSGDNWYTISNGKGTEQSGGTLSISKAVADRITHKL